MEKSLQVVYPDPDSGGYQPVHYMACLAAELLNGELVKIPPIRAARMAQLGGLIPRKRRGSACLVICPAPGSLASLLLIDNWRRRYGRLVAWVFDSFWTNHIPWFASVARVFDHIFVTEQEDLDTWRKTLHCPVEWLPWGADVLRLGSANACRRLDLLRVGRQPREWEDDASNARACESRNLLFRGRPARFVDATANQRSLMAAASQAKYVLAFSNLASPGIQTHPQREYITGRWTAALASGATVAGISPRSDSVRALLWPEALLDLGTTKRAEGLDLLISAVARWTPTLARTNYSKSLERLDWRWRFKIIADKLGVHSPVLDAELCQLNQMISSELSGAA
jgi:hypothetical protein